MAEDGSAKVVFITGAGEHLGKAMAIGLSRAGYKVVATGHDPMVLAGLADRLQGDSLTARCDITSADDCENAVKMAIEKYGRIDVLINNAGIYEQGSFSGSGPQRIKAVFDVVVSGTAVVSAVVLNEMVKHHRGQIINILDIRVKNGIEKLGENAANAVDLAAKNAKRALTESLRLEAIVSGITMSNFYMKQVASDLDIDDSSEAPIGSTHPADAIQLLRQTIETEEHEVKLLPPRI